MQGTNRPGWACVSLPLSYFSTQESCTFHPDIKQCNTKNKIKCNNAWSHWTSLQPKLTQIVFSYHPLTHLAEFWYRDASERSQNVTCANKPLISASCRSPTVPSGFLQHLNLCFNEHFTCHGRGGAIPSLPLDLAVTFCSFANSLLYNIHFYFVPWRTEMLELVVLTRVWNGSNVPVLSLHALVGGW